VLVRESRQDKLAEISTIEVKARQWARFTPEEPEEPTELQELHTQARQRGPVYQRIAAADSLLYAREHIFERISVAQVHQLKTETLRHGRAQLQLEVLKFVALLEERRGVVSRISKKVATEESVERERAMILTIRNG
jgi:hypothetical protein